MATAGDLIAATSMALGVQEASVLNHFRALRLAGHVEKAGRGLHGARMTAREGAMLLLAAAGSPQTKDTLTTLDLYGGLPPRDLRAYLPDPRKPGSLVRTEADTANEALTGLGCYPFAKPRPLVETMAGILDAFGNGVFKPRRIEEDVRPLASSRGVEIADWPSWVQQVMPSMVRVRLFSPRPAAAITFQLPGVGSAVRTFGLSLDATQDMEQATIDARLDGELLVTREFGLRAFQVIAAALQH